MSAATQSNLGEVVETLRFSARLIPVVETSRAGSTVVRDGLGTYHVVLSPQAQLAPGARTVAVSNAVLPPNPFSFAAEIIDGTTSTDRVNIGTTDQAFAFADTQNLVTVTVFRSAP